MKEIYRRLRFVYCFQKNHRTEKINKNSFIYFQLELSLWICNCHRFLMLYISYTLILFSVLFYTIAKLIASNCCKRKRELKRQKKKTKTRNKKNCFCREVCCGSQTDRPTDNDDRLIFVLIAFSASCVPV